MALQYMRRHKDWLKYFFWLVIAAFIILYVPALEDAASPGQPVGHVGDETITVGEFQRAYFDQLRRYQQLYRGQLDDAALRSLQLGEQVFESLVAQRLVVLEAHRLGLRVDDEEVRARLTGSPEFQRDGRFVGGAEIRTLLERQGISVEEFERQLREQILREKLESLITDGVVATPREVEREFRRRNQRVKVGYVLVDAERFADEVEAGEDEVREHFEANAERYRFPERRVLRYLLVDREAQRALVTVTDADVEAYYRGNEEEFLLPEQVCARHVLIKVAAGGGEGHPEEEARALAEEVLAEARAGADFAELAEARSEDLGSASNGGDLGCFERGRMVPEFDDAAFELEAGELSEVVKTSFGYHVIEVTSRRDETVRPHDEVREGIRSRLVAERVQERLERETSAIAQALRDGEALEEAAAARGLEVQTGEPLAPGETPEPLGSPLVASRAFRLEPGEVDPDPFAVPRGVVFIALEEVLPARPAEFAEVAERVREDLLEQKRLDMARALADELRSRAERQGLERAASALELVRKETPNPVGHGEPLGELGSGAGLVATAYELGLGQLSEPVRVEGGWAVLEVLERDAFDPVAFERQRESLAVTLEQQKRSRAFQAYMSQVRERIPVARVPEVYERVVG